MCFESAVTVTRMSPPSLPESFGAFTFPLKQRAITLINQSRGLGDDGETIRDRSNGDSRSFLLCMVEALQHVASVDIPDANEWHLIRPSLLLLPSCCKPPVGMHCHALNVVRVAEEVVLGGLLALPQPLVHHHTHCPSEVGDLTSGCISVARVEDVALVDVMPSVAIDMLQPHVSARDCL